MSELSDEARALLAQVRQGVDDEPDAEDRARVRAKVAAALALSTLGGTAASAALPKTAAAQLASASLSTKLVVASLVVATAGAAVVGLRGSREPARRDATRPIPAHVEPSSPPPLPTPALVARPADDVAEPVQDAEHDAITTGRRAAKAGVARRTDAPAEAEPERPLSLQAELALITAAQEALRAGRPGVALERASEHAARFPKGALIQERLGIDAIAACALGQRTRGLHALEKLARRAPNAPLLARARAACREPDAE